MDENQALELLEGRVLDRFAPGTRRHRILTRWGHTEALSLGEGPPLLLLHGGFGDAFHWAPIMPALAARHRVIAVHRPGHGLAAPFDYTGVDVVEHGADFIEDVIRELSLGPTDIAANSIAGPMSAAFAMRHPERVRRLLLVGAPAGLKRSVPTVLLAMRWPVIGGLVRAAMARASRESVRDFWARIITPYPDRLDDDMLEATAASQRRNLPSWTSFAHRILSNRGLHPRMFVDWASVPVPVGFVWGERDVFGPPEDSREVRRSMKSAELVRVADAGHLPWLEEPDAVVAAMEQLLEGATAREIGGASDPQSARSGGATRPGAVPLPSDV